MSTQKMQITIDELKRLKTLTKNDEVLKILQTEISANEKIIKMEKDAENTIRIQNMAKKATMKDYIIPEEIKKNCTNSLSGPVKLAKNTKSDTSYIPAKKENYRRLKKTDYSWDQTVKKVSFYLNGCENVQASSDVKIYYNPENKNQVCFILTSNDNKEYIFNLPPFMGNINQKN